MKNTIQDILCDARRSIRRIERWIAYRTYNKYHVLKLGTKPGYADPSDRMLKANFAVLVSFIEEELASMASAAKKFKFKNSASWKGNTKRELGLEYLHFWETLPFDPDIYGNDLNQKTKEVAAAAKELYVWWKDVRPNRVNVFDQEMDRFLDDVRNSGRMPFKVVKVENEDFYTLENDLTPEEQTKQKDLSLKSWNQEQEWDEEDQQMLQKLISIRLFLWC